MPNKCKQLVAEALKLEGFSALIPGGGEFWDEFAGQKLALRWRAAAGTLAVIR